MERGEGERLHSERRRKFWLILGALAGVGMVGGFVAGFAFGYSDASGGSLQPGLRTAAAAGVLMVALATVYGSWRFFVSVDEVEVADNLWGSLIGFYAFAILAPAWWVFNKLDYAPAVDWWVLYGVSMITATAAYLFRKWQSR